MNDSVHNTATGNRLPIFSMVVWAIVAVWIHAPAEAHELRPTIVTADIGASGAVDVLLSLNLEAQIAGIGPEHSNTNGSGKEAAYDRLRAASPDALRKEFASIAPDLIGSLRMTFDGETAELTLKGVDIPPIDDVSMARISTLVLSGTIPPRARTMVWAADRRLGDNVIRVTRADETTPYYSAFLSAGKASEPIALEGVVTPNAWSGAAEYVRVGFVHILPKGLDHILFIIGLFLLSPRVRALLWQVTSFTLAHSVTLSLGIYGLVSVSPAIVEPLIAASIAFVAIENLFTDRLHRWRPLVVFAFGLLHGLGFAGVLSEIGLPRDQFATALIAFNVGVELGQLAVLAACFLAVGLQFRNRRWYRQAIAMPASVAVAFVATYWFVERISQ